MIGPLQRKDAGLPGEQVLQRIALLTLAFGFATASVALAVHRVDWAKGLAGGAILGWLNFRWLRRGIWAMLNTAMSHAEAVQSGSPADHQTLETTVKSRISIAGSSLTLLFRYALVALGVYVIFIYLNVPLVSIGLGMCALIAAIMTASVWEAVKTIR